MAEYFTDEEELARFNSTSDSDRSSSEDAVEVLVDAVERLDKAEEAAISRKRSLQRTAFAKTDVVAKRTRIAHGQSTTVSISAQQRVTEFPGETFTV